MRSSTMNTKDKLISALTEYDRKASRRAGYNHYALAQYLERADAIMADIEAGADMRAAILAGFRGELVDCCLMAVGLPASTREENQDRSWVYQPTRRTSP